MNKFELRRVVNFLKKRIRRTFNQISIQDYKPMQFGWTKYEHNPVLGNKISGTLFDPFVRYVDGQYVMCVSKRNNGSVVFYYSSDGIEWGKETIVLTGIKNSWEDIVNRASFTIVNGKWYMWYTGQHNGSSSIGVAVSDDGKIFNRIIGNPILKASTDFEGQSVMNPCVIWDEYTESFMMWYSVGEDYEPDSICFAKSVDGINWEKYDKPLITNDKLKKYKKKKVGGCDVFQKNGKYYVFYVAYQNIDVARIAVSIWNENENRWTDYYDGPIIGPSLFDWDGHSVYKPTVCEANNKLLLWYNGRKGRTEKIGYAYTKLENFLWKNY